jgi:hypothetical protein
MDDEKGERVFLNPLVIESSPEELDKELVDSLVDHLRYTIPELADQIKILTLNLKKVLDQKTAQASSKTTTKKAPAKKAPVKKETPGLDFDSKEEPVVAKVTETVKKTVKAPEPKKVEEVVKPKEVVKEAPKDELAMDFDEVDVDEDEEDNPFA